MGQRQLCELLTGIAAAIPVGGVTEGMRVAGGNRTAILVAVSIGIQVAKLS
jgi:hypothetical protein